MGRSVDGWGSDGASRAGYAAPSYGDAVSVSQERERLLREQLGGNGAGNPQTGPLLPWEREHVPDRRPGRSRAGVGRSDDSAQAWAGHGLTREEQLARVAAAPDSDAPLLPWEREARERRERERRERQERAGRPVDVTEQFWGPEKEKRSERRRDDRDDRSARDRGGRSDRSGRDRPGRDGSGRDSVNRRRDAATLAPAARPRPPRKLPGGKFNDGIGIVGVVLTAAVGVAMLAVVERAMIDGSVGTAQAGLNVQLKPKAPKASPSGQAAAPAPGAQAPVKEPVAVVPLADQVRKLTLAQRGAQARRAYGTAANRPPIIGATRFSANRDWAIGTTAIPVPAGRAAMPQVALFVARLTGGKWQIALSGTPRFNSLVRVAPAGMIPGAEKQSLTRFSNAGTTAETGLMLPWKAGDSWSLNAAVRRTAEGTRPLGLVSFSGGDGKVLAAGAGRLYRFCTTAANRGMVMVVHTSGLASLYYQMNQVTRVPDGTLVQRGAVLGRTGTDLPCGGAGSTAKVQFGLRKGADEVPLADTSVGGWIFRERAVPLVGWAERGALQTLPGGVLRNFGAVRGVPAPALPDIPDLPTSPPAGEATPDPSPQIPQASQQ